MGKEMESFTETKKLLWNQVNYVRNPTKKVDARVTDKTERQLIKD